MRNRCSRAAYVCTVPARLARALVLCSRQLYIWCGSKVARCARLVCPSSPIILYLIGSILLLSPRAVRFYILRSSRVEVRWRTGLRVVAARPHDKVLLK